MTTSTHRTQKTVTGTAVTICAALTASIFSTVAHADADSYQQQLLLSPPEYQLAAEARGRIMIYDGLDSELVDRAMEEQFDRIDNMMFTRTRQVLANGSHAFDDDGC